MPDEKKYTEKTEVTTETNDSDSPLYGEHSYKKETTVKTEKKVEEDDKPVVIVENK